MTVDLIDEDGTFIDAANAFSVHVNNVAPTIAISGAANVDEGSAYSLTLGAVSDPGTDTVSSWIVHWGDGNSNSYSSDGIKTHTYADGPDDHAITVDLVDEDGTFLDRANALSVHVSNVAPTVTLSAGNDLSVDESGLTEHEYSYSISDPGTDDVDSVSTSCGANGDKVLGSDTNTNSSGSFKCTFPDGSATTSSTVSVSATDSDSDTGNTDTQSVSVSNVAPTAHLSGPRLGRRGLDPHLQLHGHRSGPRHLHRQHAGLPGLRDRRQLRRRLACDQPGRRQLRLHLPGRADDDRRQDQGHRLRRRLRHGHRERGRGLSRQPQSDSRSRQRRPGRRGLAGDVSASRTRTTPPTTSRPASTTPTAARTATSQAPPTQARAARTRRPAPTQTVTPTMS